MLPETTLRTRKSWIIRHADCGIYQYENIDDLAGPVDVDGGGIRGRTEPHNPADQAAGTIAGPDEYRRHANSQSCRRYPRRVAAAPRAVALLISAHDAGDSERSDTDRNPDSAAVARIQNRNAVTFVVGI